ncbi:MAG: tetratricopeptide repeat protein [Planctomycetes bacterium]|nr:tetratricopeptide repeat protein [Planctomycetota bacterium]
MAPAVTTEIRTRRAPMFHGCTKLPAGRTAAALIALFLSISPGSRAQGDDPRQAWNELNSRVVAAYQAGNYAGATSLAQEALELARRSFGEEDPATLESINNLAILYGSQGRYGEAEDTSQEVRRRAHPADRVVRLLIRRPERLFTTRCSIRSSRGSPCRYAFRDRLRASARAAASTAGRRMCPSRFTSRAAPRSIETRQPTARLATRTLGVASGTGSGETRRIGLASR